MSPPDYRSMMEGKDKDAPFQDRLRMVRHAQEHGIRAAARVFRCERNTVKLWLGRYEAEGVKGLEERSRAPHRIPHKTTAEEEEEIVVARKAARCMGPVRLKEYFGLKRGKNAIGRVLPGAWPL